MADTRESNCVTASAEGKTYSVGGVNKRKSRRHGGTKRKSRRYGGTKRKSRRHGSAKRKRYLGGGSKEEIEKFEQEIIANEAKREKLQRELDEPKQYTKLKELKTESESFYDPGRGPKNITRFSGIGEEMHRLKMKISNLKDEIAYIDEYLNFCHNAIAELRSNPY